VRTGTRVTSVSGSSGGYSVATQHGTRQCRAVILASGAHNVPVVHAVGASLPASVRALTAHEYREPSALDPGGVLVGGSATGLQIAEEIHASGRLVTLAVGAHVRMPRIYRGRDIQWWLDAAGILDERYDEVEDLARARRVPSPQLIGSPERRTLDLNALAERGVDIVGRLAAIADGKALFSGALRNDCKLADLKLARLLERLDRWHGERVGGADVGPSERFAPTHLPERPRLALDFARARIATVIWATGFRPDYGWLHVPALDRKGRLRHDGGVVLRSRSLRAGLPFMRRRKSSFIHGAGDDARDLADHLARYLHSSRPNAVRSHTSTDVCDRDTRAVCR
jgi:putative flavoprotein involved in K+ transport